MKLRSEVIEVSLNSLWYNTNNYLHLKFNKI